MWGLPGPRIEPIFPALSGRFLTTRPPGKPRTCEHILKMQDLKNMAVEAFSRCSPHTEAQKVGYHLGVRCTMPWVRLKIKSGLVCSI